MKEIYNWNIDLVSMSMKLKEELDLLKKEVLSENQRMIKETGISSSRSTVSNSVVKDSAFDGNGDENGAMLNRPSRREAYIVYYKLSDKSNVKKVQFSYALTGRTNQIGVLQKLKGKKLGRGCLLVPSMNLENIQKFFKYWSVDIATQKILLVD